MTNAMRTGRTILGLLALLAAGPACDATPLPYPPDLQTDRLALASDDGLTLTGSAGAARPAGATLRLRNASRPAPPATAIVAADGSFSLSVTGVRRDTLRVDGLSEAAPRTLAYLISSGGTSVRRVAAPTDADGDGYGGSLDCDDGEPVVFPGAAERCDGLDNDCNGVVDEGIACAGCVADADCGDGSFCNGGEICAFGRCEAVAVSCDDGDPATPDVCDPAADACLHDPLPEPACGNGALEAGEACDDGNTLDGDPCNSTCSSCTPAAEFCNGLDDDCDGAVDEGMSCFPPCSTDDDCADGLYCTSPAACVSGSCTVLPDLPCDDGDPATVDVCHEDSDTCTHTPGGCVPAPEICNGLDDDCDGATDEDFDPASDERNCGACGTECAAGQTCTDGVCSA